MYYHPGTVDAAEQTTELAADTLRAWALDEDLKTGITGGDYRVAFEIDEIDLPGRQG